MWRARRTSRSEIERPSASQRSRVELEFRSVARPGMDPEEVRWGIKPSRNGAEWGRTGPVSNPGCENRTSNPGHTRFHSVPLQSGRNRARSGAKQTSPQWATGHWFRPMESWKDETHSNPSSQRIQPSMLSIEGHCNPSKAWTPAQF